MISCASDNNSGVHPQMIAALEKANHGYALAYGDDEHAVRDEALFRKSFAERPEVRLMTHFDSADEHVDAFAAALREALGA